MISTIQRLPILFLVLVLCSVGVYWQKTLSYPPIDFCTQWAAAQKATPHQPSNIYTDEVQRELGDRLWVTARKQNSSQILQESSAVVLNLYQGKVAATGTPFLYALIGWLFSNDFEQAAVVFRVVCFLAFLLAHIIFTSLSKMSVEKSTLLAIFLLSWYMPLTMDIRAANFNQLQLLVIAVFAWLVTRSKSHRGDFVAGLVAGLGVMAKPTIFLAVIFSVIPLLVDQKNINKIVGLVGGMIAGASMAFIAGAFYFRDFSIWKYFGQSLPRTLGFRFELSAGNIGLSNLVHGLTGINLSITLLIAFVVLFCLVVWLSRNKSCQHLAEQEESNGRQLLACLGLGIASMLLSSGLVWDHYLTLFIPVFYTLLTSKNHPLGWLNYQMIAGLGLILLSDFGRELINNSLAGSVMANVTIIILSICTLKIFSQERGYFSENLSLSND